MKINNICSTRPFDYQDLAIKAVNSKAKKDLAAMYSLTFETDNTLMYNGNIYQLKVMRLLKNYSSDLKKIQVSQHLNQIYVGSFNFLFMMLIFKDNFIFCKVPESYIKSLRLSRQHNNNKKCYQTEISINYIVDKYSIEPESQLAS